MGTKKSSEYNKEIENLKNRLTKKNKELKEVKTSNLFLETLFNGITEEIMVIDRDFIIKDVNQAFLTRYNLKKQEVIGQKCFEIKERTWMPCNMENAECPVAQAEETDSKIEITHSFVNDNEEEKEFTIILYPLTPKEADIKYYLEITRDVSEHRHLINSLQSSEKRFKAILDTATDAIISFDNSHKILLFNKAASRIFDYSGDEVIGRDFDILLSPASRVHQPHMDRFLDGGESDIIGKTLSLEGLRKNGEKFPIELSLSSLEMEGVTTFTAIIRDIKERQQLKTKMFQSERLAAVGQAVAHVAHEIRNPLMIMGGFSNQIRTKLDDDRDIYKVDMILEEVERLERLVANLGDFTKEYKLLKRPADINSVIIDVIKIMKGICSPEKYDFKNNLSHLVNEIECDPDKLKQVFINLLSNGIDAMPDGGSMTISTEHIPRGVEIRISDEGSGIHKSELQRIFEPFYTTRERGSGLGLSISYKLIEAHNGDIWATSIPGKGTTFIIQLPA